MNNKKKFKKPVCMICGKKLESILNKSFNNVNGGVTFLLQMPYGSLFDGNVYQVALCDECIEKCEKEKKIRLMDEGVLF